MDIRVLLRSSHPGPLSILAPPSPRGAQRASRRSGDVMEEFNMEDWVQPQGCLPPCPHCKQLWHGLRQGDCPGSHLSESEEIVNTPTVFRATRPTWL